MLFDHSDKYMVHASRREKPGMAEVHTMDADIVYVLDGTATLVTGGKPVTPNDRRGRIPRRTDRGRRDAADREKAT